MLFTLCFFHRARAYHVRHEARSEVQRLRDYLTQFCLIFFGRSRPFDRYFRPGPGEALDFDANDDGFTPNFGKVKDDLDVPAFLRKQMD